MTRIRIEEREAFNSQMVYLHDGCCKGLHDAFVG
jgi:hypothetical protein